MKDFLANNLPFWTELTPKQQESLVKSAITKRFCKGEVVFNPLKRSAGLKIIRSGQMKIYLSSGNGNEIMLYRLRKNDVCILSIMSLMKKFNLAVCARAEEAAEIVTLPEAVYMEINQENQAMKEYNQSILIERISEAFGILSSAAWGSTEQRLAELLLYYQKDAGGAHIRVTHEILAEDIGTAREVISRTLKQFQDQGLIKTERGRIQILDKDGLAGLREKNGVLM